MKKSLPIILLSVFTLAFSAVGFLGIQPVKATTEVAGITIEDGAVGYEGVSITHADQATNEDGDAVSSGEGKMKFYSSLTQDLYNSLQGKDFKTGTLIIPAELLQGESVADKLNTLDITKVGANGAINVDTTNVWTLYDVDDDKEENDVDDAYWAMASLYNIPRAYYGVPMAARSYLAVKGEGDADYTYVYSATNDVTDFYSLTTTALKKLEAGDYDEKEDLKTAITNDYTTFKVTFHFDEMNKDVVNYLGYEWQPTKTFTVKYGGVLPKADDVYNGTFFMNYLDTQYKYLKGFYNKNRSAFAVMLGLAMNANDVSSEVGGSATPEETYMPENDAFMTRVYGDMHLYEEVAPANLLDDFSTAQSVTAAYSYEVDPTNSKRNYKKILQNEGAAWYAEKTDVNGVTEEGVLAIPSQFASASSANSTTGQYAVTTNTHLFHFTSSIRNHTFWSNSYYKSTNIADVTADDYYTGSNKSDYDYVNFRILVDTSLADVETVNLHGLYGAAYGNYANQNPTAVPVGEWINIKMLRGHIESIMNASSYGAYREQNVTSNSPFVITAANNAQKVEGAFTLYVDYMAYERDMRISVNGEDGYYVIENTNAHNGRYPYLPMYEKVTSVVGQEVTLGTALTNGTIVYNVTDPDGENVTLSGEDLNKFIPTKLGTYTVKASCDDYVLQATTSTANGKYQFKSKQYGEMTFEVIDKAVTPVLKDAEGNAIDLETPFNIGNPVTIDFTVAGLDSVLPENATYEVKYLANDSTVEVINGVFTPVNAGQYSIAVKYAYGDYEYVTIEEVVLDTVGRTITPTFSVSDAVIDVNNPILIDSVVTISTVVEGIDAPESANFSYEVVRLDSVESNNVEIDVVDGSFVAGYVGTYNVIVYYKEGDVTHASEVITLTVKVDGRYVNDFSDSSSVMAAYRVDYLKGDDNGAGGTYGSSDLSHKASYTADDIAPNTTWVAEHEGRYGVIKTQPQGDHTPQYNSGALQSRLGIHLRSADYRTYAAMNAAGVTRVVYDQDTTPSTNQNYLAYNCANWDYISVPVYFPAPEGKTSADTIKVGIMYASQLFDVPYNTWYELQLDKPRMTLSYGSPDLLKQFIGDVNGGVTALFFLAQNDETAAANLNQEVYIDSVSFEKYEGYEAFESLNFYNVTDNEVAPTVYEFAHYTTDGSTYVALEEKDFVLQAKVDGKDIAVTDLTLRYQTWANNMQMTYYAPGEVISNEDGYYLDDDAKLSGRGNSGYVSNNNGLYRIHVSAVTSAAGAIATNRVSYYCFGYDYTDPETNKKYRGYTMLACKPTIVDAPTA